MPDYFDYILKSSEEDIGEIYNGMDSLLTGFDMYNICEGNIHDIDGEQLINYSEYLYNEMMEFCKDDSEIMSEGAVFTTIKKGFKNFFELLKKFFTYVIGFFKWLINKFKNKIKKTADQIAEELGIKGRNKGINESDLVDCNGNRVFLEAQNLNAEGIKYRTEKFPAAPGSVLKPTHIKFVISLLRINIQTTGSYVIGLPYGFEGKYVKQYADSMGKGGHIAVKPATVQGSDYKIKIALMYLGKEYNKFELMNDLISKITSDPKNLKNDKYCDTLRSDMKKIASLDHDVEDVYITHSNLMGKFGKVNKLASDLRSFVKETDTCATFNTLAKEMMNYLGCVTMGLNAISAKINCMHMIDASYLHSITDLETLGKFVNEMIKHGFDTKDVAYNTWCVMDKSYEERSFFYKWDKIGSPEEAPRWGQSRVVFFPKKQNYILKCATNGMGLIANDTELNRYKLYRKHKLAEYLCAPYGSHYNHTIIEFEKLKPVTADEFGNSEISKIQEQLSAAHREKNLPQIGDLHMNNFGKNDSGEYKVLDYAG